MIKDHGAESYLLSELRIWPGQSKRGEEIADNKTQMRFIVKLNRYLIGVIFQVNKVIFLFL